jgi:hypothetical protein
LHSLRLGSIHDSRASCEIFQIYGHNTVLKCSKNLQTVAALHHIVRKKSRTFLNCHKLFSNTVSISLRAKIKPALDKPCRYFTFCTVLTPEIVVAALPLAPILFPGPSLPFGVSDIPCFQARALVRSLLSRCFNGWDGMGAFGTFYVWLCIVMLWVSRRCGYQAWVDFRCSLAYPRCNTLEKYQNTLYNVSAFGFVDTSTTSFKTNPLSEHDTN